MDKKIFQQIAHHYGEIQSHCGHLQRLYAQLANSDEVHTSEPPQRNGAVMCDCGKPAKSYKGVAKSGPKEGQGYVKYFCADNHCDFKKFVDA